MITQWVMSHTTFDPQVYSVVSVRYTYTTVPIHSAKVCARWSGTVMCIQAEEQHMATFCFLAVSYYNHNQTIGYIVTYSNLLYCTSIHCTMAWSGHVRL